MLYQLVYETQTGRILAIRPTATPRDDVTLGPDQALALADIDVGDRPLASLLFVQDTGEVVTREDWDPPEFGVRLDIAVTTATRSPIDDVPELPADGAAEATIVVQKRAVDSDRALTGAAHNNLLTIRTTAGTLSERQVALRRGQATFSLRSSKETVVAEVRVAGERIPQPTVARIEFAPV